MKIKHGFLALLLLIAPNACSDDDPAPSDVCEAACSALDHCSMQVPCNGLELPHGDCVRACQRQKAQAAANCVLSVGSCDITRMTACRNQMPCN